MKESHTVPYPEVEGRKIEQKYTLYVLKLEKGRYYVGRVDPKNLQQRIRQHRNMTTKQGAAWTRRYKVVEEVTSLYEYDKSPFDQDRKVKELMYLYGVNMVRGGAYSQIVDLGPEDVNYILRQFYGSTNKCFNCGASGHWVKNCPQAKKAKLEMKPQKKEQSNQTQNQIINQDPKEQEIKRRQEQINKKIHDKIQEYWYLPRCLKCNQYGHYANHCDYETFEPEFRAQYKRTVQCWNCGKFGHYADDCWELQSADFGYHSFGDDSSSQSSNEEYTKKKIVCFKCGTPGHLSTTCWKKPEKRFDSYGFKNKNYSNQRNYRNDSDDDSDSGCYNCGRKGHWATNCWFKKY